MRIKISNFLYLILGFIGFKSVPAMAAQDIFLCLEGENLEGETESPYHPGCIDVISWSWGAVQEGAMPGPGGEGKVKFDDISIVQRANKASPELMLACATGSHLSKAEIFVDATSCVECPVPATYYKIVMEDVIVTSVSIGGSDSEDALTENLTFNYAKVEWCYSPQNEKKTLDPPICKSWDVVGEGVPP